MKELLIRSSRVPCRLKTRDEGGEDVPSPSGPGTLSGYIALFDSDSLPLPEGHIERIRKGAFLDSLSTNDVRALKNHNKDAPLGRLSRNLRLWEDDKGLAFELELPDTTHGRDAYVLIADEIATDCSFGFYVQSETWESKELVYLEKVDLIEVSVGVTWGQYEQPYAKTNAKRDKQDEVLREIALWNYFKVR